VIWLLMHVFLCRLLLKVSLVSKQFFSHHVVCCFSEHISTLLTGVHAPELCDGGSWLWVSRESITMQALQWLDQGSLRQDRQNVSDGPLLIRAVLKDQLEAEV